MKKLLDEYENINLLNIKEFYNLYIFNLHGVKGKISSGKIREFYEELKYERVAAIVNIADDKSSFKTIHKAKGDEFEDVLVIVPARKDNKHLDFLLSPDMSKEEHRVYYVGLSRAKNQLYVNVPELTEDNFQLLDYFDVVMLKSQGQVLRTPVVN